MPPVLLTGSRYREHAPPRMRAAAYKSWVIVSPRDTTVTQACQDAGCMAWRHGWESVIDERTELGQRQAAYIRRRSGRTFTERRTAEGVTIFRFEAFQRCFADHRTRPERFIERGGDYRGNPRGERRVHVRAADWVESSAEHQGRLIEVIRRG